MQPRWSVFDAVASCCAWILHISENCEYPLPKNDGNMNGFWCKFIFWDQHIGDESKSWAMQLRCLGHATQMFGNRLAIVLKMSISIEAHFTRRYIHETSSSWSLQGQTLAEQRYFKQERVSSHITNTSNSNRLCSANSIRDISERLLANVLGHSSPAHLFQEYLKMSGGLWKVNWDDLGLGD